MLQELPCAAETLEQMERGSAAEIPMELGLLTIRSRIGRVESSRGPQAPQPPGFAQQHHSGHSISSAIGVPSPGVAGEAQSRLSLSSCAALGGVGVVVAMPRALQQPAVGTALVPAQTGLLGWAAGVGWGEGREVRRGGQALGWAGQCSAQGNSSIREWWEHAGEGSQQGLVLQSQGCTKGTQSSRSRGEEATLGPWLAWAEQEGGPGHSSSPRSLPGPARRPWSIQGQALLCGHKLCVPSSCHDPCGGCSRGDPRQPFHGTLPTTSPQSSQAPSLLLSDVHQDLPVPASQHIC